MDAAQLRTTMWAPHRSPALGRWLPISCLNNRLSASRLAQVGGCSPRPQAPRLFSDRSFFGRGTPIAPVTADRLRDIAALRASTPHVGATTPATRSDRRRAYVCSIVGTPAGHSCATTSRGYLEWRACMTDLVSPNMGRRQLRINDRSQACQRPRTGSAGHILRHTPYLPGHVVATAPLAR